MRINVSLIVAIIVAVGGVAFIFTAFQISAERDTLNKELEAKTIRASDHFFNDFVTKNDSIFIDEITDSAVRSVRIRWYCRVSESTTALYRFRNLPATISHIQRLYTAGNSF
jgi:hypothetical protein